jgi:hypothetical protein
MFILRLVGKLTFIATDFLFLRLAPYRGVLEILLTRQKRQVYREEKAAEHKQELHSRCSLRGCVEDMDPRMDGQEPHANEVHGKVH